MSDTPTITIDLSAKCAECGDGGATPNGMCLACTSKAIAGRPMKSPEGKAVQHNFNELRERLRRTP